MGGPPGPGFRRRVPPRHKPKRKTGTHPLIHPRAHRWQADVETAHRFIEDEFDEVEFFSRLKKGLDCMAIWPYSKAMSKPISTDRAVFRSQARVMKALANESRLMIVDRLSRGECSAGELTQLVGSDQTTVSKHLAVLRAHGIVEDRREGSVVIYRLLTPCVVNFFSCATQVLKESR